MTASTQFQRAQLLTDLKNRYHDHVRERRTDEIAKRREAVPELLRTQILDPRHPQCGGWGDATSAASPALSWNLTSLRRLTYLAQEWGDPQSPHHRSPDLASRINLGAAFYATLLTPSEPFPGNWWGWQIGFPRELCIIFMDAGEALDENSRDALLASWRYMTDHMWDYHASANCMEVAASILRYAICAGDPAYMQRVKEWAERSSEVVADPVRQPQGFRRDGSYFYHGARVNLAYAMGHLIEFAWTTHYLSGTPWALGGQGLANCVRTLLDFAQWALIGTQIDPFILDRSIAIPENGMDRIADGLLLTGLLLLDAKAPRADEIEHYCVRLRTAAYPGINRLNRKGWHTSDGQLILRFTGQEYTQSVYTTMDWERLSGITRADGFRLPHETHGHGWFSAGAISPDGLTGCCGLDFAIRRADDQCEIAARKNWFMLQDAIVATGSNIWTTAPVAMETIIRQVALPPELEDESFEEGEFETQFIRGHDCSYILPDKPRVKVYTQWREGRFDDIGAPDPKGVVYRRRYWTALIPHGSGPHPSWGNPKPDGQYTIVYLPGMNMETARLWWAQKPFEVLQKNVLAHRLYDCRRHQTLTVQQWKGAFVKDGRQ